MILSGADLKASIEVKAQRKTKNVPVPKFLDGKFGKDCELLVTQMTIEGYLRNGRLMRQIIDRKLSEDETTGLLMCASLISCIVDDTGAFLFDESQLDWFYNAVDKDTFDALLLAHGELNPPKEIKSFDTKKKKS